MKIMKNFLTAIVFISLVAGSIQAAENNPERPPDLNLVNRDRPGQDRIDSENGEFRPREGRPGPAQCAATPPPSASSSKHTVPNRR